jgi:hypothetical protein
MIKTWFAAVTAVLLLCAPTFAQQTTGNITGRVIDQQEAAMPGVTVTATNPATGFTRVEVSDAEGVYRLSALPVGFYDLTAELQGFTTVLRQAIEVNVARTVSIDFNLPIAQLAETVNVTAAAPLVNIANASVGQVVDIRRIENLPLNGRQFANLAATVPGVGLGFHTDPTKSTQYAPQINGGNGRNVNYTIDGGDNNDDTVGGLLQQFPLEAIQEFNFQTQRFKAEYGRSNGGVMNVVTKSGTNTLQASFFELFRDAAMNVRTQTERRANVPKQDYRRNQFGGSAGGPIARDRVHFFFALERTQQDTKQAVNTRGLFPNLDGIYPIEYRENIGIAKMTAVVNPAQYLSVRYGRNTNGQPYGASPVVTPETWGDSTNTLNSINANYNWVLAGSTLNEFIVQFADFSGLIAARSSAPNLTFPNGVITGANINTPQSVEQQKYQLRDDFSWHVTAFGGLGHDFKAGVNFINEPRLYTTLNTAKDVIINTMLNNDPNGPVRTVSVSTGDAYANIPNKQYGAYIQDDWRVSNRLTLNLGLRYDLVTGIVFDQSLNPNFVKIQAASRAGLLEGIIGLENFGLDPRSDRNNIQPRVGAVYDLSGTGRDVIRAGWGIYTDFGFTNSNVLLAAQDANGSRFGNIFNVENASGILNADGAFYRAGQPLSNIASQNQATGASPVQGQWVDPRLQQPRQLQTNVGWSHELTPDTVISVDYVNSLGRDLNVRPILNTLIPGTTVRRISARLPSPLSPNTPANRPVLSRGRSRYDALILSARRRLSRGIDYSASYTLSRGLSTIGNSSDELNVANIVDANDPFDAPVQFGPNLTTDARHRLSMSAVFELPYAFRVAPFFLYRSSLPLSLIDGRDLNGDGMVTDLPPTAYAAGDYDADTGIGEVREIGPCRTVNCGRTWPQSQLNLRVSRVFGLPGRVRVEAIAEIFNVFNALNPSQITSAGLNAANNNRRVTIPAGATAGQRDPTLLQPVAFSGDFQRSEQRSGQIGFRVTF